MNRNRIVVTATLSLLLMVTPFLCFVVLFLILTRHPAQSRKFFHCCATIFFDGAKELAQLFVLWNKKIKNESYGDWRACIQCMKCVLEWVFHSFFIKKMFYVLQKLRFGENVIWNYQCVHVLANPIHTQSVGWCVCVCVCLSIYMWTAEFERFLKSSWSCKFHEPKLVHLHRSICYRHRTHGHTHGMYARAFSPTRAQHFFANAGNFEKKNMLTVFLFLLLLHDSCHWTP